MAEAGRKHRLVIRITPLASVGAAVLGVLSVAGHAGGLEILQGNRLLACSVAACALGLYALIRAQMHKRHLAWSLLALVGIASGIGAVITRLQG